MDKYAFAAGLTGGQYNPDHQNKMVDAARTQQAQKFATDVAPPQMRSIDSLAEAVRQIADRESNARMRIIELAARLGYHQPDQSNGKTTAPQAIPNGCLESIADTLRTLAAAQDDISAYLSQIERHI